jgi:hypothetical protein
MPDYAYICALQAGTQRHEHLWCDYHGKFFGTNHTADYIQVTLVERLHAGTFYRSRSHTGMFPRPLKDPLSPHLLIHQEPDEAESI